MLPYPNRPVMAERPPLAEKEQKRLGGVGAILLGLRTLAVLAALLTFSLG